MENTFSHLLPRVRSTIATAAAAASIVYPTTPYCTNSSAQQSGPLPISMADYFSASRALLSRWGRQTERAAHLHVSCSDKTNFEPPDEIRRTGCEFVIQSKGVLYHWEPIDASVIFSATWVTWRYTNESSNSMSCKALSFVLSPIGF